MDAQANAAARMAVVPHCSDISVICNIHTANYLASFTKISFCETSFLIYLPAIHGGIEGVAEKQMANTYEKAVAVEGTENATGNSSEVRRFFGAEGAVLLSV